MMNNPRRKQILRTATVPLIALLALATMATARAAETTNARSMSKDQSRYEQELTGLSQAGQWKDPDKVLPQVSYEGLPLGEIVRALENEFKGAFDVLLPRVWEERAGASASGSGAVDPNTGLPLSARPPMEPRDWLNVCVALRLKNVTASEVFNAMNLYFEINNTPLRWELTMNGKRPTALLRVLEEAVSQVPQPPPQQPKRMIFFVGDLIGDPKTGGMTMDQIIKTVVEVHEMSYGPMHGQIQSHREAQLIVATGTPEQIGFVGEALHALTQKVELDRGRVARPKTAEPRPQSEAAKGH